MKKLIVLISILLCSCGKGPKGDTGQTIQGQTGINGSSVGINSRQALSNECLNGGFVIETWSDLNNNGTYESAVDNHFQVSAVCNGSQGITGANGQAGTNGHSVRSIVRNATNTECSNGGKAVDLWLDLNDNGVYNNGIDSDFETIYACNGAQGSSGNQGNAGVNGQNAVLSSGQVGPSVTNKPYSACHHDYLYLSNGWLLFRHQANGTADQGAGTTGFDVWNVDISDFALISEIGNTTYCTLHYNKVNHTLSYTVNTNSDGLSGITGNINL